MAQPKPKPPVKKYTAQDSVNYQRMMKRQESDIDRSFEGFPKETPRSKAAEARMERRSDSLSNSPYFKAKAKVEVKNGVTSRTLTETTKKAKSTKPAPAKPMAKVAAKKMVSAKKPMMKGTK